LRLFFGAAWRDRRERLSENSPQYLYLSNRRARSTLVKGTYRSDEKFRPLYCRSDGRHMLHIYVGASFRKLNWLWVRRSRLCVRQRHTVFTVATSRRASRTQPRVSIGRRMDHVERSRDGSIMIPLDNLSRMRNASRSARTSSVALCNCALCIAPAHWKSCRPTTNKPTCGA
jgi:hypothetical protein